MGSRNDQTRLPSGIVYSANQAGEVTQEQLDRIRRYKAAPSRYRIGCGGFFALTCMLAEAVIKYTDLVEKIFGAGKLFLVFGIMVSAIVFMFFFVNTLSEIVEGIWRKSSAQADIRQHSLRSAEGYLSITARHVPGIQIPGRMLQVIPSTSSIFAVDEPIEAGKKYRVIYLERSGIAISAEEIGSSKTVDPETYQLALAGRYSLGDLERNQHGKPSLLQLIFLLEGISAKLFVVLFCLFFVALMAPLATDAVHYAPPHTWAYSLYVFFLQIFPLGAIGLFLISIIRDPLSVLMDILAGKLLARTGTLIKPFDVSAKQLAQPGYQPKIEIDGQKIGVPALMYPKLKEGQTYTVYYSRWSNSLLSIEFHSCSDETNLEQKAVLPRL